jgi:hypothetical protein
MPLQAGSVPTEEKTRQVTSVEVSLSLFPILRPLASRP